MSPQPTEVDSYVSINEICQQFDISRATFYRMLADPKNRKLQEFVVRIPPGHGRIRVPLRKFEMFIKKRQRS